MSAIPKNDMRQRMEGRTITTLGDYIEQKSDKPYPKKLTFDEWVRTSAVHWHLDHKSGDWTMEKALSECWKAAQANK